MLQSARRAGGMVSAEIAERCLLFCTHETPPTKSMMMHSHNDKLDRKLGLKGGK
jgi:hypothetical protein